MTGWGEFSYGPINEENARAIADERARVDRERLEAGHSDGSGGVVVALLAGLVLLAVVLFLGWLI